MTASSEARAALREILPVLVVTVPFGAVYGTVAAGQGLTIAETLGLSATIFAGASQLAAIQMIGLGSPLWVVIVSVFALNFRHVLYSASIGRHLQRFSPVEKALAFFLLTDPSFGSAEARAAERPLTKTFYFTYNIILYVTWLGASAIGAIFGGLIEDPHAAGLDFVLPIYFLTLLMAFRTRANFLPIVLASGIASALIYVTLGAPWHITLGAFGGILYAVLKPTPAGEAT
ncbi:branched-chain amino acid ABC transporter permease [Aureimonas sp. Leaf454]|uniref:AzlC family ABC transporter permease n=1 Tax=Aureimonas sp. Leaf454 TaxID=1736381 RepID=UPI0006F358FF|nr:AzlC family ABC transporter permease [Aureimonas sp. Leaf454]KQT50894.1 branched-chain amino acid ABC transporter permease [Aureimonas sp. Leaf454]